MARKKYTKWEPPSSTPLIDSWDNPYKDLIDDVDLSRPMFISLNYLSEELARVADIPFTDAKELLRIFGAIVHEHLVAGRQVVIPFVGKLTVKHAMARICRNPYNGEPVYVADRWRVSFTPYRFLRSGVRNAGERHFVRGCKAD